MTYQINIGKNGITEAVVNEIRQKLKKEGIVKVKFLKPAFSFGTRKQLVQEIALKTGGMIEKQVGFTVVLRKQTPQTI